MLNYIDILLIITTISLGILKIGQKWISQYFEADTISYFIQYVSVICLIPVFLFFVKFTFTFSLFNIVLVIIAGTSWYIGSLITNRSIKATDLTLREPILSTRTIFVLLFSALFLKEHVSLFEYIGGSLIVIGSIISSLKEKVDYKNLKTDGLFLSFLAAFLVAISYTFDKYALNFIDVLPWVFMMYLVPLLLLLPKTNKTWLDIKDKPKKKVLSLIVLVILVSIGYISLIFIFSKTDLSKSFPISQLSSVIVFLGGLYLGERNSIRYRILGSIIAIIGGVIIFLN